jgi:hypothetical protein
LRPKFAKEGFLEETLAAIGQHFADDHPAIVTEIENCGNKSPTVLVEEVRQGKSLLQKACGSCTHLAYCRLYAGQPQSGKEEVDARKIRQKQKQAVHTGRPAWRAFLT